MNAIERSQYNREYYQKNKAKWKHDQRKMVCTCGQTIQRSSLVRHLQNKNHRSPDEPSLYEKSKVKIQCDCGVWLTNYTIKRHLDNSCIINHFGLREPKVKKEKKPKKLKVVEPKSVPTTISLSFGTFWHSFP